MAGPTVVVVAIPAARTEALTAVVAAIQRRLREATAARAEAITVVQAAVTTALVAVAATALAVLMVEEDTAKPA